ncbi:MAG TPA: FtsX-like permease family protein [Arachidicoccus sp.]|nr:FtsX-like permease family protein [Arachidicoccus sp.]
MIKNYFKTAWRNLFRNKIFSLINVLGLALGLTFSLFIFLWVKDEQNIGKFNQDSAEIFKVYERQFTGGTIKTQPNTPGILAAEMKKVLPQVQFASGFSDYLPNNTFRVGDKIIEKSGAFADEDFFKIFNYHLINGSASSALSGPVDIAISKSMAMQFYGSAENAISKTIRFNDTIDLRVSSVFEIPKNAPPNMKFEYLINWKVFLGKFKNMQSWSNTGVSTFVMLKKETNPETFKGEVRNFLDKYADFDKHYKEELGLQRFDEMYLYSQFDGNGNPEGGRIAYVRLFSLVAFFILLIACINFMNLTTARSAKRAKEVGVRKIVGAYRLSLILQFLGEALVLAFISMIIAIGLVNFLLPVFNQITQKNINFPIYDRSFWLSLVTITIFTGLISGVYPALFLSSFNPIKVLKGSVKTGRGSIMFRRSLVVLQFVLSIILIIAAIVVSRQVNYIQTKNLGYNRNNLIYIQQKGALRQRYKLFKQEVSKMPSIESISRISSPTPTDIRSSTSGIDWEMKSPNIRPIFSDVGVGYEFANTMKIDFLLGHDFRRGFATDSVGYILNETAVKEIGYKDPIGKSFSMWGEKGTIIGVVRDFNFTSLRTAVGPMILYLEDKDVDGDGTILIRAQPGKTRDVLTGLESTWKKINPEFPFSYSFADAAYEQLYKSEQMAGRLSNIFAVLAIFISCLGLLGLVMFTAEQRRKEIGIRKVMGARPGSLFILLSREFIFLVLIASLIAMPIAWISMNNWLQNYSYHIHFSWWIFAVGGGLSIFLTLLTVSFQAIKAARINPIISLRTE